VITTKRVGGPVKIREIFGVQRKTFLASIFVILEKLPGEQPLRQRKYSSHFGEVKFHKNWGLETSFYFVASGIRVMGGFDVRCGDLARLDFKDGRCR